MGSPKIINSSHLLTYALVEALEWTSELPEVERIYDDFINNLHADLEETSKVLPADELTEKRQEYTVVYVNYMQFVNRSKGAVEARSIFRRAKSDQYITWHIYEAAAMLEYHYSKDKKIPGNVFASAYANFGQEVEFVLCYMRYLTSVKDRPSVSPFPMSFVTP